MSFGSNPRSVDRLAKFFVDSGAAVSREAAVERLAVAPIQLVCAPSSIAFSETLQLTAAAVVATGIRAFPAGVKVIGANQNSHLRFGSRSFSDLLEDEGATHTGELDPKLPTIVVGDIDEVGEALEECRLLLRTIPRNWAAGVVPGLGIETPSIHAGTLGAALAGALSVCELFHAVHELHPKAGHRDVGFSFFEPSAGWREEGAVGPDLTMLPKKLWLLGLGHLGQANAWLLRALPWEDRSRVTIWLQDVDVVDLENVGTSLLSQPANVDETKCRRVAEALEEVGLKTKVVELLFRDGQRRFPGEADVAMAGFDKPTARQPLDGGGWSHLVDAGIGAGAGSFTQFVLHRLGGRRTSQEMFDVGTDKGGERLLRNVEHYRRAAERDPCGALQLAEQAVGTSFVGLTSAVASIAEILRPLHGGQGFDALSGDLTRSPSRLEVAVRESPVQGLEWVSALPMHEGADTPGGLRRS